MNGGDATTGGDTGVIELSSEDDRSEGAPDNGKKREEVKTEGPVKTKQEKVSTIKGFCVANPLETKDCPTCVQPATTNANEAISLMGNYFTSKPECDEACEVQSYQMMQAPALQSELQQEQHSSQEQVSCLNKQLYQGHHHADHAEDEVQQVVHCLEAAHDEL